VKSYVARSVVAFVQEFGERILPHPYKGGGETKSMQAVRIEVIKYHSCAKIAMSYNDVGGGSRSFLSSVLSVLTITQIDLHVEAGGTYCPMVVEESPVASQGQVLAYRTNFSQRSHDETTKEFFASPRQIRYYVNSSGVQESSRGVDFAAGKWGAQPSAEPYTFRELVPFLVRETALTTLTTRSDQGKESLASARSFELGA